MKPIDIKHACGHVQRHYSETSSVFNELTKWDIDRLEHEVCIDCQAKMMEHYCYKDGKFVSLPKFFDLHTYIICKE